MTTLTPISTEHRIYEIAILYPLTLSQKEESTLLKEIDAILEEAHAKLIDQDVWKDVGLAYQIGKQERGRMLIRYYEMAPSQVKQADAALRILPRILRHLIIKPEEGTEIVKYSERFEEWLQYRKDQGARDEKKKEDVLRKKIVTKAVRKDAAPEKEKAATGADLEEKLGELISGDDLNL